jgi:hypothetical protein
VAVAALGRAKSAIYQGLRELQTAGVLLPLSQGRRNQSWEAIGLLDLLAGLEAGDLISTNPFENPSASGLITVSRTSQLGSSVGRAADRDPRAGVQFPP